LMTITTFETPIIGTVAVIRSKRTGNIIGFNAYNTIDAIALAEKLVASGNYTDNISLDQIKTPEQWAEYFYCKYVPCYDSKMKILGYFINTAPDQPPAFTPRLPAQERIPSAHSELPVSKTIQEFIKLLKEKGLIR